jgi:hypothetical protein
MPYELRFSLRSFALCHPDAKSHPIAIDVTIHSNKPMINRVDMPLKLSNISMLE